MYLHYSRDQPCSPESYEMRIQNVNPEFILAEKFSNSATLNATSWDKLLRIFRPGRQE
jgi:hypothetical protein